MASQNPKDYTIHMIGNAHIDPIWLWTLQEGRNETRDTCQSAIDRMEETPGFTFTRSSASAYRWIEEDDPELFKKIEQRVREGRWSIVNGWWEQPDCNIPAGESFVRQGLYGKRYFREKFGVDVVVGYNVDSFGHNGSLPQILKKCGFKYYIFFRPSPEEKKLPASVFWWESPDGSRVLACRPPLHYCSWGDQLKIDYRIDVTSKSFQNPLKDVMCFYGVGNHGGGPTKEDIQRILQLAARPEMPNLEFSTVENFFKKILTQTDDYPVVAEDLQYFARGCYTSLAQVKKYNRQCETLLLTAEKFSSIAHQEFGAAYPQQEFTAAWRNVLFNQFHDVMGGTCIPGAYLDVYAMYEESLAMGLRARDSALHAISSNVKTIGKGLPILVFNPSSWKRSSLVEVDVPLRVSPLSAQLLDENGRPVHFQGVEGGVEGAGEAARLRFIADVPALGYRLYRFVANYSESPGRKKFFIDNYLWKMRGWKEPMPPEDPAPAAGSPKPPVLQATNTSLENEFLRLTIDPQTGCLTSLYDKEHRVELVTTRANRFVVIRDEGDPWAMGINEFRDEVGEFALEAKPEIVEQGPVRATLRLKSKYENSHASLDLMLYASSRLVECRLSVDWHEKHKMLKVSFPLKLDRPQATYQTPYGFIVRPTNGEEQPGQAWIDLGGTARDDSGKQITYGVSLLNDCKYGFDVKDSDMRMTILRSPMYGYFADAGFDPKKNYEYIDQGRQTLRYALLPHAGDWRDAGTVRAAEELNNPLIGVVETLHGGRLGPSASYLECSPSNVICTVLKKAEDSADLVLRLYETAGRDTQATIKLPEMKLRHSFNLGHHEIKTFKIVDGNFIEMNMIEERTAD